MHQDQTLEIAGVIFNDMRRTGTPPEQIQSKTDVTKLAQSYGWPVLNEVAHHSDSYPAGSRAGKPIFHTEYARDYVVSEFRKVAAKFLSSVGVK